MFAPTTISIIAALAIGLGDIGSAYAAYAADEAGEPIDFTREIQPILQHRCLKCHGPAKQHGGLRLDAREFAEAGGATGQPLLDSDIESNALIARITSSEEGFRMPLEGPPLAEHEVTAITRWIAAGAEWPTPVEQSRLEPANPYDPWWSKFTEPGQRHMDRLGYTPHILLTMLIAGLVLGRIPERKLPRWAGRFNSAAFRGICLLLVLFGGAICYAVNVHRELSAAQQKIETLETREPYLGNFTIPSELEPFGPMRPERSVTPEYYRGNDERSPQLFNGGFYRTATFRLSVRDAQQRQIDFGDSVGGGPLSVRVELQRAAHATPRLFTPAIMRDVVLSPVPARHEFPDLAEHVSRFETLEEGELWECYYPIETPATAADDDLPDRRLQGWIYLCKGTVNDKKLGGSHHFRIEYDLEIVDGRLGEGSNLTMGCLDRFNTLQMTPPELIQQIEWFDYRPIPEITAPQTADDELLGVDEHLGGE